MRHSKHSCVSMRLPGPPAPHVCLILSSSCFVTIAQLLLPVSSFAHLHAAALPLCTWTPNSAPSTS